MTPVRFNGENLTSLHILLSRGHYLSFEARDYPFFDPSARSLRNIVVSAYGRDLNYRDLWKTLRELAGELPVPMVVDRLTIRDVSIHKFTR